MNNKKYVRKITEEQKEEARALKKIYLQKKDALGIKNQDDIAEYFGIGQAAVSHYLNGINPLNLKIASAFSEILKEPIQSFSPRLANEVNKISSQDLLYQAFETIKKDSYLNERSESYNPSEILKAMSMSNRFPVISWSLAGSWKDAEHNIESFNRLSATTRTVSKDSFWLEVKDNSMTAPVGLSISEGMLILVDPSVQPKPNKLVIAKLDNHSEVTFKKYIEDGGAKYLVGLNPSWPMRELNDDCEIIGVIVEAKWEDI